MMFAALAALIANGCSPGPQSDASGNGAEAAAKGTQPAGLQIPDGPVPGLWRMTTEIKGIPGTERGAMPAIETCVAEAASFEQMEAQNRQNRGAQADCTNVSFRRQGDGFAAHAECRADGRLAVIDTTMAGDFSRQYVMTVKTRLDPPPRPDMAETTMTMTAERISDC